MNKKKQFKNAHIVYALIIVIIAQFLYIQYRISTIDTVMPIAPTGKASGQLSFCLNTPPQLNNTCNLTIPWGYPYTCNVSATDPNPNSSFRFYSSFIEGNNLFNISVNGTISFTAQQNDTGNYTIQLIVYDQTSCENNYGYATYNLTIINTNHPPELIKNITDKIIDLDTNTLFYLNEYYSDPDNDNMTYTTIWFNTDSQSTTPADQIVTVTINPNSQATIRAVGCGAITGFYYAEDEHGLITESNRVNYTVNCPEENLAGESGSGGGGGGGGGGITTTCIPEWFCGKWGPCLPNGTRIMECSDRNGCDEDDLTRLFYKNCTYVPEEYTCYENWQCSEWSACTNSTTTRICTDQNACGTITIKPNETQTCSMQPSCFNGLQDGGELGIDCGGDCRPCNFVETPGRITTKNNTITLAITAFSITILGIIAYAYRKSLHNAIQQLTTITALKPLPVILTEKEKEILLAHIEGMRQALARNHIPAIKRAALAFTVQYTSLVTKKQVTTLMHAKECIQGIKDKELALIFESQLVKSMQLIEEKHKENGITNEPWSTAELQAYIDECRQLIYLVATFTVQDARSTPKDHAQTLQGIDESYRILANSMLALTFNQVSVAKTHYQTLTAHYATLNGEQQKQLYPDIVRLYHTIKYREKYEHA